MPQSGTRVSVPAVFGLATVGVFLGAFAVFSQLAPGYDALNDYISQLGSRGQSGALWWNLIGFVLVGGLFTGFAVTYGKAVNDWFTALCLTVAGIGFALGGIPTDMTDAAATMSVAHFVSICLCLAGWFMSLARMSHLKRFYGTNAVIVLSMVPVISLATELVTAPIAHRMMIAVVFGWVLFTSIQLLRSPESVAHNES